MNTLAKKQKFTPGKDWIFYAPDTRYVFDQKEIAAVVKSLKTGWLGTGKITDEFQKKVAQLFGKKYGLFVNSGSSANLLALEALNLPKGSEVITPACTFNTTIAPIVQNGLVPVVVDVELETFQIDPKELAKAVSSKTKALLVPHLIGNFVELKKLRAFAKKHRLFLIEDSCDTLGGVHRDKPSGSWSDITTTSFYASHIITAGGAGGMLMTDDLALYERARVFANWGRGIKSYMDHINDRLNSYQVDGKPYDSAFAFVHLGYNFKPTEIQAAFGLKQLERLPDFIASRAWAFNEMNKLFAQYTKYFILPKPQVESRVNWLAYPLTIKKGAPFTRNEFVAFLEGKKIQTRPVFSGNITKHHAYKDVRYRVVGDLSRAQHILHHSLLLAAHHTLTPAMIKHIKDSVEEFIKSKQS